MLVVGLALRLLYLSSPYLDAHGWRQVDTAAIARNFYEGSLNPLYPRVDWGGADGRVEAEFPLVPWIVALAARLFGFHDWLGRLVVVAFSLGLIWAVYRLVLRLDGRPAVARAAAAMIAISPAAVFFGRTLMPDTPMLFFTVLALTGFYTFSRQGTARELWMGSVWLALACLVKLPAVIAGLPVAVMLLSLRGWRVLRDWRVWSAATLILCVVGAWYWHASGIFKETGLTFGILGAPAKTYPGWISAGPWPSVFSKWSTSALLTDPEFYERLLARLYHFHLTPLAFVAAFIGAWLWKRPGRIVLDAWLAAMVLFVLIAGEGHRAHDYYQLPFVAIAACYFGAVAWPLFDASWLEKWGVVGQGRRIGLWLSMAMLGGLMFYYSGATQTHFKSLGLDTRTLQTARSVDEATDDRALAIVVDDYGITSPILLYYARLKGWSFDVGDISPALIDRLRRMGARYFVTTQWQALERERPEAAAHLLRSSEMQLQAAPADVRVFRLR